MESLSEQSKSRKLRRTTTNRMEPPLTRSRNATAAGAIALNSSHNLGSSLPKLLNDLPPEVLVAIIEQIGPLQQLMAKYRGVCRLWRGHIEKLCYKSKSLFLTNSFTQTTNDEILYDHCKRFSKEDFNPRKFIRISPLFAARYYFHSLYLKEKNLWEKRAKECCQFITRLCPEPTELMLDCQLFTDPQFIRLLFDWSPSLCTLSLKCTSNDLIRPLAPSLYRFLNACSSLQRLNLFDFQVNVEALAPDTLARIERIYKIQ